MTDKSEHIPRYTGSRPAAGTRILPSDIFARKGKLKTSVVEFVLEGVEEAYD